MKYGFILARLLGHATHSQNLKCVLAARADISSWCVEVPFVTPHRLYGRMGKDLMFRIYMDTLRSVGSSHCPADALFFHTMDAALFSPHVLARTPSIVSLDATPLQFKRINGFDRPLDRALTVAEQIKVAILKSTRLKWRLVQAALDRAKHIVTWSEWAKGSVPELRPYDPSLNRFCGNT